MNDQSNGSDHLDSLTDQLRQLRPSKSEVDSSAVFYQAGFRAGKNQVSNWKPIHAIAAGLLAAFVAAPSGFVVGTRSSSTVNIANRDLDRQPVGHPEPDVSSDKGLAQTDSTPPKAGLVNPSDKRENESPLSPSGPSDRRDLAVQGEFVASTSQPSYTSTLLGYWSGQSIFRLPFDPHASIGRNEAIRHGDPMDPSVSSPSLPAGSSARKTLAVLDVRALAEAFEVVQ